MNVRAPTTTMTPTSMATKSGVCVGNVPAPGGTSFFFAIEPARAKTTTLTQKRPKNIATPRAVL